MISYLLLVGLISIGVILLFLLVVIINDELIDFHARRLEQKQRAEKQIEAIWQQPYRSAPRFFTTSELEQFENVIPLSRYRH